MNKLLPLPCTAKRGVTRPTSAHRPPAPVLCLLLALLLLALRMPAVAQAPAWQSARAVAEATRAATSNLSAVTATAVDAAGNVYLAGNFRNTVVLGSTTLVCIGDDDLFVAKFNPVSNQFVWAQRAGGTLLDNARALAVSGTSVYVAGSFLNSSIVFGPTTLTNTAGGSGTTDVFVAKLTDAGSTASFVWAQRAGSAGNDFARALAVRGPNVYVAGYFTGTPAFGAVNLASAGGYDAFVAKLTDAGPTGSFSWAQRAGGTGADLPTALAVNGTDVYVAGEFRSPTAAFGATTLTNAGTSNAFVAKLSDAGSTGSFAWAQQAGGAGVDYALALAVSGASVYVAGTFSSSTASLGPLTLTNAGTSDVFVAKLSDAGSTSSFAWAQRAGGTGDDYAAALAASGTSVYVAGGFASPTAGFGTSNLASAGAYDAFVAKLTDAGSTASFVWAQRAGSTGGDAVASLVISGTNLYAAGALEGPTANFGAIALSNPDRLTTLGFLASLTDPTLTATTPGHALTPAQLFPNPAHHTATLRLPAGTKPAPLTLTDAQGRTVRRYTAPAGVEALLDLQGLPAGLYLLRGAGPAQRLAID